MKRVRSGAGGDSGTSLADFAVKVQVPTRWRDNDLFGHMNNAVYYEVFDSVINAWIAGATGTLPADQPARGVVAESSCRFLRAVSFPETLTIGMRAERLGHSSVTYGLGMFSGPRGSELTALGRWVHVYTDPQSGQSVPIPSPVRAVLQEIVGGPDQAAHRRSR